ncbi:phosphoribosyltransferase [Microgenomates group bacterium]|nr:phosphoribosyltransferase [Microgenomates group bacterium]
MIFENRLDAGNKLADLVIKKVCGKGLVLGIPRGGVVVAKIVAEKLGWPLDVLPAKKIGFPGNPELAVGARVKPTLLQVKGLNVILVDDGVATGLTIEAGINWLRQKQAKKIIVAVPVAAKNSAERLKTLVDEWICLHEADDLYAVGQFYQEFGQEQ